MKKAIVKFFKFLYMIGRKLLSVLTFGLIAASISNNTMPNMSAELDNPIRHGRRFGKKPQGRNFSANKLKKRRRLAKMAHESRRVNYQNSK